MWRDIQQVFGTNSAMPEAVSLPPRAQDPDRTLINYIWINKDKALTDFSYPVCAVELANIKLALDNANKYPDADFNIWVDKNLLDDYSLLALDCFIDEHAMKGNVTLRNLQEIPDYALDPYFVPLDSSTKGYLTAAFNRTGWKNVYSRADYARILVLDHCMESEPSRGKIIYTDIDCYDLRLAEAVTIMKKHGVVMYDVSETMVSHGYIGLAADRADIKEQFQILKSDTCEAAHSNELGFTAFDKFLKALNMPKEDWHNVIGLPNLLPPMLLAPEHLPYKIPAEKLKVWEAAHAEKLAEKQATAGRPHRFQSRAFQKR